MLQHIAGYHFFDLAAPAQLKEPLRNYCRDLGLRGTILLAPEGINLYLSGEADVVNRFKEKLHGEFGIPEITYKETQCQKHAYTRMLVKVKKEIVTMGVPGINVPAQTGPTVTPKQFKQWIEEGKDMLVIDTRNDYETCMGKFESAIDLGVENFREFAQKAATLPDEMRKKPVVMYCTGGIRCEKASAQFIHQLGFEEVYQLEGGILNYFKQCGNKHWNGECFVFDHRVTLDANLEETSSQVCFACQWPLSAEEVEKGPYELGEYCPHCFERYGT